jgi:hypothetical protein
VYVGISGANSKSIFKSEINIHIVIISIDMILLSMETKRLSENRLISFSLIFASPGNHHPHQVGGKSIFFNKREESRGSRKLLGRRGV